MCIRDRLTHHEMDRFVFNTCLARMKIEQNQLETTTRTNFHYMPRRVHAFLNKPKYERMDDLAHGTVITDNHLICTVLKESLNTSRTMHNNVVRLNAYYMTPKHLYGCISPFTRHLEPHWWSKGRFKYIGSTI